MPEDVASIDSIIRALYASISFGEGEKSDWHRLRSLFFPAARLVYKRPDGIVESVDVETFVSNSEKIINKNKLKAFNERELSRKTEVFGSIELLGSSALVGLTRWGNASRRLGFDPTPSSLPLG